MRVYLAGQNGAHLIQQAILGGTEQLIIYLAGGISGNLKSALSAIAKHKDINTDVIIDEFIKFLGGKNESFLAGADGVYDNAIVKYRPYILESFYYTDADTERLLPHYGDFLLDSGAFTFMSGNGSANWNEYIEKYADFINRNNITKYFELDIDSVVGYDKVKEYRSRLEKLTNRPCIPVWHTSRGYEEFKRMCDEYSYVAIGGIVSKEIRPEHYKIFPKMISEAHKKGAKIHGLGFTNLSQLPNIHFDSVDSTTWTTGNRFGFIYKFNGKTMVKIDAPKGKRLADSRVVALNNYMEWIKFQKYADTHL